MLTVAWCVLTVAGHVWACHMNEGRDVSSPPRVRNGMRTHCQGTSSSCRRAWTHLLDRVRIVEHA